MEINDVINEPGAKLSEEIQEMEIDDVINKINNTSKGKNTKYLDFEDYVCSQWDYNVCEYVFLREQKKWRKYSFIDK